MSGRDGPARLSEAAAEKEILILGRRLWVGTDRGLFEFDRSAKAFRIFSRGSPGGKEPAFPVVTALAGQEDGSLWAGTREDGLIRLGPDGRILARFRRHPSRPDSLGSDSVLSLCPGPAAGAVWVETDGGLDYF